MEVPNAPANDDHHGRTASPAVRVMAMPVPVSSAENTFDAAVEAALLRVQTRARRRSRYRRSRLDRYKGELLALREEGCTTAELQRWLLAHRIRVHHATVARWLRRHEG